MGLVALPHKIENPNISSAVELNENYNAISNEVNGKLDGNNMDDSSGLTSNTLDADVVYADKVLSGDSFTITLPSSDGSHSVSWQKQNGDTLLHVSSNGDVTFFGIVSNHLAVGTIMMYDGTAIPDTKTRNTQLSEIEMYGWYVCNGQAGTPNLVDRFIRGSTSSGGTGGSDDVDIIIQHNHTASSGNNSASHSHTGSAGTTGSTETNHYHRFASRYNDVAGATSTLNSAGTYTGNPFTTTTDSVGAHYHTINGGNTGNQSASHNHTITVNNYGSSGTNKNIPAYYSVIFIVRMS